MTDQLRDKFKKLRLAAELKERDEALAVSAAEKARRAEEAALNAALDGVVKAFKDELPDAVALLAEVGVKAQVGADGVTLVVGTGAGGTAPPKTLGVRRVGLTVVVDENGRPAAMLEYKTEPTKRIVYVDGKAFEGWPERLSRYMDRLVSDAKR